MKFNKSLIALAVSGAVALPAVQGLQAAEHTFTWGGNLRVESTSKNVDDAGTAVETLSTSFGGRDDESTTGGDTFLQLNYGYSSDDGSTTGSGFVRFASDRNIRIGVTADAEGDVYAASMTAEWQQLGWSGVDVEDGTVREDRDQFAVLTHKPTSLYFKIGRDEPFGNEKGYTTDFLSATRSFADTGTGRVAGHILGWKNSDLGLDLGLFLQRDNTGQASAKPFGYGFVADPDKLDEDPVAPDDQLADDTQDVNGVGFIVKYASGPIDAEFITGSSTAETNVERVNDKRVADGEYSREVGITQLHVVADFGQFKPFVNFGSGTITDKLGTAAAVEGTRGGNNLGVSIGLGYADLVVAFGSAASEKLVLDGDNAGNPDATVTETTYSGFDLMFATNQAPLYVSLAYTSGTEEKDDVEKTTAQYGVRFDYGF